LAEQLNVELVAADRKVWSGEASIVIARTSDGEIGILPGHAPILGVLLSGAVQIRQDGGEVVVAAVYGGFLSVANNDVVILAEEAELAAEIDVAQAQRELDERADPADEDAVAASQRARARIRAAELAS
jgi:F-type H+-transporting ATPase subunit epsilon